MKNISAKEFKIVLDTKGSDPTADFINVCSTEEYDAQHIKGVRSVPLDEIASRIDEFSGKDEIYIHCFSGRRGEMAMQMLRQLGVKADLVNVDGGIMGWQAEGFETQSK